MCGSGGGTAAQPAVDVMSGSAPRAAWRLSITMERRLIDALTALARRTIFNTDRARSPVRPCRPRHRHQYGRQGRLA